VKPYATWTLAELRASVGGATYDPTTKRVYVSEMFGDAERPRIHVFDVR